MSNIFAAKYQPGSDWDGHSGGGSSSFRTIRYRSFLQEFVFMNNIRTVIDVGCGDWQFSRFLDFGDARYVGFDVVEDVVSRNRSLFGSDKVEFNLMPSNPEELEDSDLLIMKDVLQHMSNKHIQYYIRSVFPKFKNCLITNSFRKLDTPVNVDVGEGDFRCLDLTQAPFLLRGAYVCEFSSNLWEHIRTLLVQR